MNFQVKVIRPAPYQDTYDAMRAFTAARTSDTPDEIWLCEHPPVYTLGLAGKPEHVLAAHHIPVIQTDRGGQVTYHGPGQIVAYILMDMRRCNYYVRDYVRRVEQAVINTLQPHGVHGFLIPGAPGVYVHTHSQEDGQNPALLPLLSSDTPQSPDFTHAAKIAALGVKVTRHCTYHGVSLNLHMDLQPFQRINPCGYAGLKVTDFYTMGVPITPNSWEQVATQLSEQLIRTL